MKYRYREPHEMKDSGVEWLGMIPNAWGMKKINWLFNCIGSGTTPSTGRIDYYENGEIDWLLTGDLNDTYINKTSKKITTIALNEVSSLQIHPVNTLVIAMYGATIGKLGITTFPTTTNQACSCFSSPQDSITKFIFYWFMGNRKYIIEMGYGGGQPNISQNLLKNLRVSICNIYEQQKIANFLDQKTAEFDSVIEKKEKLIEKLEEAKKSLISEVVTGKKEVQVISKKLYKIGNDGQEQEIFEYSLRNREPHEMKDSGVEWLGMIPQEWEVTKLKYLAKISNGKDQKEVLEDNGKYPILGTGGEFGRSNTYLYNKASVLLGRKGTIDKPQYIDKPFWTVDTLFYTQIAKNVNPKFFFYLCQTIDFNKYATKTALPSMTQEDLNQIKFSYNNKFIEQQKIADCLDQKTNRLDSIIQKNKDQIKKIKEAKQSLISEAVTGKIEVL